MLNNKNKTEILAPAGNMEAVRAAVNAHTDAVYLGGSLFSARAFAGNFDEKELLDTIDYCHRFDVKVYMAINTLLKNDEIQRLTDYVEPYYREGVDGIIVQDMGVVNILLQCFPDLPLHGSTQLSVSSQEGAAFLKNIGMTRFVPSRELSLDEIRSIKDNVDIEIETFVHGAMCYCYSGRCLMSSYAGGRSGNRGRCAQPCRKRYMVGDSNDYALSLKDMCMLRSLDKLIDAGIDSFKIEGRMKKPEYVAATVDAYRSVRDAYMAGIDIEATAEKHERILLDIYNRGGFYSGYYFTRNGREMLANERPNHTGIKIGQVGSIDKPFVNIGLTEDVSAGDIVEIRCRRENIELTCNVDAVAGNSVRLKAKAFKSIANGSPVFRTRNNNLLENVRRDIIDNDRTIRLDGYVRAQVDEPLQLTLYTEDGTSVTAMGAECLMADQRPVSAKQITDKIGKTGGTSYIIDNITEDIGESIFVQISAVNALRRQALSMMDRALADRYKRSGDKISVFCDPVDLADDGHVLEGITIGVSRNEQISIVKNYKCIDNVIVDYNVRKCGHMLKDSDIRTYLAMPEIMRQKELGSYDDIMTVLDMFDGVVIKNYDELGLVLRLGYDGQIILDSSVYAYNDHSSAFYNKIIHRPAFISSAELTMDEIDGLSAESVKRVYGYQRVMVTAGCISGNYFQTCGDSSEHIRQITDEMGNRFYVQNSCSHCYNVIYNGVPTSVLDRLEDIYSRDGSAYIEFTIEDARQVRDILDHIERIIVDHSTGSPDPVVEYTRGHFYKGID